MLLSYKRGQASIILRVKILNSSVTTGAGLTGLTSASSGLIISTIADNEATATAYTVAGSTIETIATLGTYAAPTATKCRFKEVDATNHKGVYEIQVADARFAVASAKSLTVSISGATNAAELDFVISLQDLDPYDSVRAGLTALPNAAAAASNGLLINGTNVGTVTLAALTVTGATTCTGNVSMAAGLTITQSSSNAHGLSVTGNGTGHGILSTSGSGSASHGIFARSVATNGSGIVFSGAGTGDGINATGGATGRGLHAIGGATSGAGFRSEGTAGNAAAVEYAGQGSGAGIISTGGATGNAVSWVAGATSGFGLAVRTTSGDALSLAPTAGHAISAVANGTSKHGILATGGAAGTSDGISAVAGTGGVDIRGNITGTLSTVTNVTNAATAGDFTATQKTSIATAVLDAFATASDSVQASPTPTTTAFAGSSALSSADGFYAGSVLLFTSGALDGLARKITTYTGSTRLITVTAAWPAAPTAADTFRILGRID